MIRRERVVELARGELLGVVDDLAGKIARRVIAEPGSPLPGRTCISIEARCPRCGPLRRTVPVPITFEALCPFCRVPGLVVVRLHGHAAEQTPWERPARNTRGGVAMTLGNGTMPVARAEGAVQDKPARVCAAEEGCERAALSRGLCGMHYQRVMAAEKKARAKGDA